MNSPPNGFFAVQRLGVIEESPDECPVGSYDLHRRGDAIRNVLLRHQGERELMFGRRKHIQDLEPPPIASTNPEAVELLRVWAAPGRPQQLTLRTTWKDPGAWGLLLADIARHAAQAYAREGQETAEVLRRIRELFDAEWSSPTDDPKDLTDAE